MTRSVLTALLLCGPVAAAEPPAPLKVVGPTRVPAYRLVRLSAENADPKAALIWDVNDEDRADADEGGGRLTFTGPPGVYKVKLREITFDAAAGAAKVRTARLTVTIGDPPPVPPVPPGPVPPGPTPDPAAPFAGTPGLRVLILYESADLTRVTPEQMLVLFSQSNRAFLDAVTPAGPDGKTHEWRMWDKDVNAAGEAKVWQDALAKFKPASTPWLLVGNGTAGFSGPLPGTVAEFQAVVTKYKVSP